MKISRLIAAAVGLLAAASGAIAQNNTISPYSRFGYGLLSDQANTVQKSMGGVGIAMRSGRQINFMNPASYAGMDSLTFLFDMGLDIKTLRTTEGNESGKNYGVKYDVNADQAPDTIADIRLNGNAQMAETWGVGLNYQWGGRLMAEVDFTYQPWKKVKFAAIDGFDNPDKFNDRWKLGLGLQWVTRQRGSWLQRVNYRLGGYYSNDYIKVGDNGVREYGLSLGFGLPAPSSKTMVNLSFEYRHRQAHPAPLVKENYFVVTLGVNFNELWFFRNKLR